MTKTVVIAIDSSARELVGCSLLAGYLASMGIKCVLCSILSFPEYYARYKPEAVVWPNVFWDLSHVAEASFVFVLPSESCNGQHGQISIHAGRSGNPAYTETIERFFCWGPGMKEVLLETGAWKDWQLVVTGSPATDQWLLPRSSAAPAERRIGLTTNFRALSNSKPPRKMNYFEWLDETESSGGDGTYFLPPEHAESWVFFEASLARAVIRLVRTLAVERAETLEIRPHPQEMKCRYAYLSGITQGRVTTTKTGTISEWLSDKSILFTCTSASALDAVVRGVPVVSLRGLLDPDAVRKIPDHFRYTYEDMLWQMEDVGQAVEYVELAEKGKLKPCRDEEGIARFLERYFAFPRRVPAAQQVAIEIKRVLDQDRRPTAGAGPRRPLQSRNPIGKIRVRDFPMLAQIMTFGRYIKSLMPGHVDLSYSYWPWRLRERKAAIRRADLIRASADRHAHPPSGFAA